MVKAFNSTLSAARRPMKRTPFLRKPLETRKGDGKPRSAPRRGLSRVRKIGPVLPAWVKAIPESQSHGSGTLQKRLWRVKSDFVRIRDWYAFDGACVASGPRLEHWSHGQAGHFKPYSNCNGMFKFHEMNIHLQSASKNKWGNRDDWKNYENELIRRYNQKFVDAIEASNRNWPAKFTTEDVKNEIERTLKMLGMLPEQPDYYMRATSLLSQNEPTTHP